MEFLKEVLTKQQNYHFGIYSLIEDLTIQLS